MDRAGTPPTWLEELLELLESRRELALAVAGGVALLGVLVALLAPGVLPPTGAVGAAVGVAAVLLAVAAVVGIDAGELTVRGPRHVRATGAQVVATLSGPATGRGAAPVVTQLDERGITRLTIVPADRDGRAAVVAVVDALGEAWARAGRRVLVADLTRPDDAFAGIVGVARGSVPLGEAVRFDPELMLARLGAGDDLETALVELPALTRRLPADVERLVVALPPVHDPAARTAVTATDHVVVLARVDHTTRVDLLATLETLDDAGQRPTVLLHDQRPGSVAPAPPTAPTRPAATPTVTSHLGSDGLDPTGPLPPVEVDDRPRAPRPVPAARERTPHDVRDPEAASDAAPAHEASDAAPAHEASDAHTDHVDLDDTGEIEPIGGPPPDDERPQPFATAEPRPLRTVAHPERLDDLHGGESRARLDEPTHVLVVDGLASGRADQELRTAAVLETLAQEIWSREDLDGTR